MDPLSLKQLGQEIARFQDEGLAERDPGPAQRYFAEQAARLPPPPRHDRARWLLGAAAALLVAGIGGGWLALHGAPVTYQIGGGASAAAAGDWIKAPEDRSLDVRFSDGTEVLLDAGSRGRVLNADARGADVLVEHGGADIRVVPRRNAAWRVISGPYAIQVTGTRFRVNWAPESEQLTVQLFEGSVKVSGCALGSGAHLVGGQALHAYCRDGKFEVQKLASASQSDKQLEPSSLSDPAVLHSPTPELAPQKPAPSPKRTAASAPDWHQLAAEGRYVEAFAAAQALGFESECAQASAPDLMALGNAARLAGAPAKAQFAYSTVRQRFQTEAEGSLAAFHLARMAFDQSHDYVKAAEWFRTYLREKPRGQLAQEATGRLMEALEQSGDRAGAERMARSYLERYPQGLHAPFAKRLIH